MLTPHVKIVAGKDWDQSQAISGGHYEGDAVLTEKYKVDQVES